MLCRGRCGIRDCDRCDARCYGSMGGQACCENLRVVKADFGCIRGRTSFQYLLKGTCLRALWMLAASVKIWLSTVTTVGSVNVGSASPYTTMAYLRSLIYIGIYALTNRDFRYKRTILVIGQ